MRNSLAPLLLLVTVVAGACGERSPTEPGRPSVNEPRALDGRYEWVLDGWIGTQPAGQPSVVLTWQVPTNWSDEPFRVYGRRSSTSAYSLLATVTSCADSLCRYSDVNILPGQSYDYYVAVVDERTGDEVTSPDAVAVSVPAASQPARATAPQIVALDDMLYLQWADVPQVDRLWKYLVFLERRNSDSVFFQIGETDGNAFLDNLASNGVGYRYSIAAVDIDGHVGQRSPLSDAGFPRPDQVGALIYAFSDSAQASGFQFDVAAEEGRVVGGNATQAHWRLEADVDGWRIVPLGGTGILDAGFTTALTCGPGSDAGCIDVAQAPQSGYQTTPLAAELEHTYVLRIGSGANLRYAKLRVQILAFDQEDRSLMIFDWAMQTAPGVPNLDLH